MTVASAVDMLKDTINQSLEDVAAFRATVTAVSGSMIQIKRLGETVAGTQAYATISRFPLAVGDVVLCIPLGDQPVITDVIRRAPVVNPTITNTPVGTYPAAGTTPTLLTITGDSETMEINFTTGATPAAGKLLHVGWATARPDTNFGVWIDEGSAGAAPLSFYSTNRSVNGFDVTCVGTAPAASAALRLFVQVKQLPT